MADVKMSELGALVTVAGTEKTLILDGSTNKTMTTAQQAAFTIDTLLGAASATPATGDNIVGERSGTEKLFDIDTFSAYATDLQWSGASELDPLLTGDTFLVDRSGTVYWTNIDTMKTYILNGVQATALDLTTLAAGTISDGDLMVIGEGSTAKKETAEDVAAYTLGKFQPYVAALSACAAAADADKIYIDDNGTPKYLTMALAASYTESKISANICADVWDDASGAVDPFLGTDVMVLERGGVRYTVTGAVQGAYNLSLLSGAAALTPAAAGDDFTVFRGGVAKTMDIDVAGTYFMDYAAANAVAQDPALLTDGVIIERAGVMEKVTASVLKTLILTGIQADVLDISGLSTVTLADAVQIPVCEGTTAKKTTVLALEQHILGELGPFIEARSDGAPVVDTDFFVISRAGVEYYINADDHYTYIETEFWDQTAGTEVQATDTVIRDRSGTKNEVTVGMISDYVKSQVEASYDANWSTIDTGDYTATPASTSQINMSDTSLMKVGLPLRYAYSGSTYYGIVASVTPNTSITLRGVALNVGADLTALAVGSAAMVVVERIKIPDFYMVPWYTADAEASKDVLSTIAYEYREWRHGPAHVVEVALTQATADSTGQPYFNVKIGGALALADNSNKGPQVSATPGTWTRAAHGFTAGLVDLANDDAIEILCTPETAPASTGDASDVSIELTCVLE